MAKIHRFILM